MFHGGLANAGARGVVVRAGAIIMNPTAASQSRMFWARWRRNRIATDLQSDKQIAVAQPGWTGAAGGDRGMADCYAPSVGRGRPDQ